eukprot:15477823-Alexandrium_andersonii.AAC.2
MLLSGCCGNAVGLMWGCWGLLWAVGELVLGCFGVAGGSCGGGCGAGGAWGEGSCWWSNALAEH